MSVGSSGRIVIEVDPEIKRQLYATLARESLTLKDWFLREAQVYVQAFSQLHLDLAQKTNPTSSDQKDWTPPNVE